MKLTQETTRRQTAHAHKALNTSHVFFATKRRKKFLKYLSRYWRFTALFYCRISFVIYLSTFSKNGLVFSQFLTSKMRHYARNPPLKTQGFLTDRFASFNKFRNYEMVK
jgi:hypothetical protein